MQENFPEDLVIIGFPCNQFGMQEPGADGQEIMNGLKYVRPGQGFEPNFVMLAKGEVNGRTEHPLYTFLKSSCPPTRDFFVPNRKLYYEPIRNTDVRWNFEKFLIDKQGRPAIRYDPGSNVTHIASDVKYLIEQN